MLRGLFGFQPEGQSQYLFRPPAYYITDQTPTQTCSHDPKIVSEYDQEIPQSQTADNPVAPRGRATQPSRDTRNTN